MLSKVSTLSPLITPLEMRLSIQRLRHQLGLVQRNEALLLHAGDCAENFDACTHENIAAKIGLILSFSVVLLWGSRKPVIRVGHIAGQYTKPRSSSTKKIGDREVLSFRGDNVNGVYFYSATTLNHVRVLLSSGFASLQSHRPRDWSLSHVRSPALKKFNRVIDGLSDALDFSSAIGGRYEEGGARSAIEDIDFYTSHEGLMLGYEQALTREFPIPGGPRNVEPPHAHYNTSARFLWIGDRTRQLDGAHVEYFRGIRNPLGRGRVTLLTRYGVAKVDTYLAGHISAVQKSGHPVAWICDPMHGNTLTSSTGLKTRNFGTIISELTSCLRIHTECGSALNGVSLEFTGELNEEGFSVTECLGGSMELSEEELGLRYQAFCDPRLNFEQSLDVAFLVSDHMKRVRLGTEAGGDDLLYSELGGRMRAAKTQS
ncbi:DAHP synthetase [Fistulina hepatica ATCC 64428]|uniref:Phospho-2-dehydro-3-deoxyheptonate aldolase n=1 Tax=Fistulina hepatica ATCC 64428 TaxID=1128425 RepID=A0A0D7AK34_9AGAR|nr:DAHP synthetase [Fistulina hepatica ATCC 64428]